jgi:hypothetical protein
MADTPVSDLPSLDRDVARGAAALGKWRAAMARDPKAHEGEDPLEPVRRVAGKSTWDALGELSPSAADAPLRDALREWVAALLQARIGRDDEARWSVVAGEDGARFAGEPPGPTSWRKAWRGVVTARTSGHAQLWLDAAAAVGPRLADVARERAAKRVEIATRLGFGNPWEAIVPGKRGELRSAAARLLSSTDDLSRAVWQPVVRTDGGPSAVLHAAVAREARHGWPARLGVRWLHDTFGPAMSGLRPVIPTLPEALGASSFMRALGVLGYAVRLAAIPRAAPFALAHEPGARTSHRLAFVFASLAADPEWQVRSLGVGRDTANAQARVLARTMLLDARLHATRLLLGDDADLAPRDRFEELTGRLFGRALDPRLRGAWPAARDDEPARFAALVEAPPMREDLRDRFDADWWRNPRAWAHLRAVSALPVRAPIEAPALDVSVDALARAFEAVLA